MTSLPPKATQTALVSGYLRQALEDMSIIFPLCIKDLCFTFYNEISYFKFKGDELHEFLTSDKDEEWEGNTFKIKDIAFKFVLCPKYWFICNEWRTGFHTDVKTPNNVRNIIFCATYYCLETGSFNKKIRQYTKHETVFMPLPQYEQLQSPQLTFCAHIKLLSISYNLATNKSIYYHQQNIKMKRKIKCIWNIKDEHEYVLFDNDNWMLFIDTCRVSRWDVNDTSCHSCLMLSLLQLPSDVVSVQSKIKIKKCIYDKDSMITNANYNILHNFSMNTNERDLSLKIIEADVLQFELEIDEVYGRSSGRSFVKIPVASWEQYGIVD